MMDIKKKLPNLVLGDYTSNPYIPRHLKFEYRRLIASRSTLRCY